MSAKKSCAESKTSSSNYRQLRQRRRRRRQRQRQQTYCAVRTIQSWQSAKRGNLIILFLLPHSFDGDHIGQYYINKLVYVVHFVLDYTHFYLTFQIFFQTLLIGKVQVRVRKAAESTRRSESPAKLHPPRLQNLPSCCLICLSSKTSSTAEPQQNLIPSSSSGLSYLLLPGSKKDLLFSNDCIDIIKARF